MLGGRHRPVPAGHGWIADGCSRSTIKNSLAILVARKGSAPADEALAEALADPGSGPAAAELIAALTEVAARLRPAQPAPILRSMTVAESGE